MLLVHSDMRLNCKLQQARYKRLLLANARGYLWSALFVIILWNLSVYWSDDVAPAFIYCLVLVMFLNFVYIIALYRRRTS